MLDARFTIAFVWWPRRLAMWKPDRSGFDFIGWVWWQRARLVNNSHHGWIAFADEQTEEKLRTCPCCGAPKEPKP
jgi:hypothetical protein